MFIVIVGGPCWKSLTPSVCWCNNLKEPACNLSCCGSEPFKSTAFVFDSACGRRLHFAWFIRAADRLIDALLSSDESLHYGQACCARRRSHFLWKFWQDWRESFSPATVVLVFWSFVLTRVSRRMCSRCMFGERQNIFGFRRTCVVIARHLNLELRRGMFL